MSLSHLHTKHPAVTPFRRLQNSGVWWVALGAAFWGIEGVLRTPLAALFTSTQIVFVEHLILMLYAVPVVWLNRHQLRTLTLRDWLCVLFIAWGSSGLATILFTAAFQHGHPSVVLLLQKLQPVFVLVAARSMLGERLPSGFGFELLLAIFGTYLLTFGFAAPFSSLEGGVVTGALLSVAAAAIWGFGTVIGRYLLTRLDNEMLTGTRFLFAMPLISALLIAEGSDTGALLDQALHTNAFWMFSALAVFAGLVSMLLYYHGLSRTKASYATLAELSFPAVGLLVNWLFLGESLTYGQAIGFMLIWTVVFRIARRANH